MLANDTTSFLFSGIGSLVLIALTLLFFRQFSQKKRQLEDVLKSLASDVRSAQPFEALLDTCAKHSDAPWSLALQGILNKKLSPASYTDFHWLRTEFVQKGLDLKFMRRTPPRLIYATLVFVVLSLFFGLYDLKATGLGASKVMNDWNRALIDTLVRFVVAFVGVACSLISTWLIDDSEDAFEGQWNEISSRIEKIVEAQIPQQREAVKVEVQDTMTPLLQSLNAQLETFAEMSHTSLKNNLKDFDHALVEATTKLSHTVKEMNKHLHQVEAILEKTSKVA